MKNNFVYSVAIILLLLIIAGGVWFAGILSFMRMANEDLNSWQGRSEAAKSVAKFKAEEAQQKRIDDWNNQVYLRLVDMQKAGKSDSEMIDYSHKFIDKPPADFEPK